LQQLTGGTIDQLADGDRAITNNSNAASDQGSGCDLFGFCAANIDNSELIIAGQVALIQARQLTNL
jgi:hypothetical protein